MLILEERSTVDTKLNVYRFKICVLPSGEIVACGRLTFYVLGKSGKKFRHIPSLCEHDPDDIFGMEIEGEEYICVSCMACRNIKLVDRTKHTGNPPSWSFLTREHIVHREGREDVTVALSDCDAYRMCTAGKGISYIIDVHGVISKLDTSTTKFTIKHQFSVDKQHTICYMCYITGHDLLVLVSDWNDSLYAVRLSDRQISWRHENWTVEDEMYQPGALLYLPTHGVLMVGDMRWTLDLRIVCVRPETGDILQVIRPPVVGWIRGLQVRGQQLVILHNPGSTLRLSTFKVRSDDDYEASDNEGPSSAAQDTVKDMGVNPGVTSAAQKMVADKGYTRVTREVHGEPCRLKAGGSDVSLESPSGVNATVEVITYTDNSAIQHLLNTNQATSDSDRVPVDSPSKSDRVRVDSPSKSDRVRVDSPSKSDRVRVDSPAFPSGVQYPTGSTDTEERTYQDNCLVSPVVELKVTSKETGTRPKGKFKLSVPHFIKNIAKFIKYIRVRIAGDKTQTRNLKRADSSTSTDDYFDVNGNYIEISTSHPGVFIVTVEGINCCGSSASIYLFGSLKYYPDSSTLATVKVYISSYRAKIKDYKHAIARAELMSNSRHLQTSAIDLSLEPYVPEMSELSLRLRPEVPTDWAPFMDEPIKQVLKLNEALKFKGQHICGQPNREVAAFSVKSSTQKTFIGKVEAKVNVVTSAGGTEENTRDVLVHLDPSVRSKRIQELPPDLSGEKLTGSHLVKLAKLVTNSMDLSTLGELGLGIPDNEVQLCITNNPGNFASAVHSVLKKWRARQGDPKRERENLIEAFTRAGMVGYANQVLKEA